MYSDSMVELQNLKLLWEFNVCNIDNDMRAIADVEFEQGGFSGEGFSARALADPNLGKNALAHNHDQNS